jgi:hypothetical protein
MGDRRGSGDSVVAFLSVAGVLGFVLLILHRDYPFIGHDYRYFIPHLLDTNLHLRLSGLGVQWYTPSFGGGLPAFPNPQHVQYSALQAAAYFMNPWTAVLATTAIVSALGCVALWRTLRRTLGLDARAAALAVTCFAGNGFLIEHMIVGHIGFQLFPLSAVMFDALTDRRRRPLANAALIGLSAAAMLHQAGFYLLIIIALSLVMSLLAVRLLRPETLSFGRIVFASGGGIALALAMAGPKIAATLALMRHFPRAIHDIYEVSALEAAVGLVAQLFGVMTVTPLLVVTGMDIDLVPAALWKLTGADRRYGMWELDTGVPIVVVVGVGVALGRIAMAAGREPRRVRTSLDTTGILLLAAFAWIVIELTLARGIVFAALKQLPVLSSLHVNHRFAAVFILPLILTAGVEFDRWRSSARLRALLPVLLLVAALSPLTYIAFPRRIHYRSFDAAPSIGVAEDIRHGAALPIERIDDLDDEATFANGASSLKPYEPMFGYNLDTFTPTTWIGRIDEVRDGRFNLTNPSSLVYPELNGVAPFERIAAGDRVSLEIFAARGQPAWRVPVWQRALNWAAVAALVFSLLALLARPFRRSAAVTSAVRG